MSAKSTKLPVVFVGHGSPMNAIEENRWSEGFRALGAALPKPAAIVAISAHWYVRGTFVTGNDKPPTIHDFGGFPDELYAVQYPAAGDPALARELVSELEAAGHEAALRNDWGLDHGTWSVLHHMRPKADCPVIQLSIDQRLPPTKHVELGRVLAPLRERGVLVLGSGNITHNLRDAFGRMHSGDTRTPPWAAQFDAEASAAIERHDNEHLAAMALSDNARLAHPTLDHYLPLLYCAGASQPDDRATFPITGFDLGSLSMRCVVWE